MAALGVGVLVAACSSTYPLMPAPSVYLGSGAKPLFTRVPADKQTPTLELIYLTNRVPTSLPAEDAPYGADRSHFLAFGTATIEFGDNVDWKALASQSVADERVVSLDPRLGRVDELGRFPFFPYALIRTPDGLTRAPAAIDAHQAAAAGLQAEIARRLAVSPRKEVVVYVHGYHEKFRTAAFTTGELCHFLGREFVCAMFSWPAGGTRGLFLGYNVDRESAEYSEHHLKQAIRLIAQTPGLERLHLIAHSRGADLLISVVENLQHESYVMQQSWVRRHKIGNVVLAAPDIDKDIAVQRIFSVMSDPDLPFGQQPAPRFIFPVPASTGSPVITIYTSPDDRALSVSQLLFGSLRRLGTVSGDDLTQQVIERARPLTGIFNFIHVVSPRTDFFGHSYFTSNPAVSADLIGLLRYGLAPGAEGRPLEHVAGPFWRLAPIN